jgi:hypothetical protein
VSPETAALVSAISAAVQAAAAIVIVILTIWLARLASASLTAASTQAKAAEDALADTKKQADIAQRALEHGARQADLAAATLKESKRQRYASAVPLLQLAPRAIGRDAQGTPFMTFDLSNHSDHAALHARVGVFPESDDRRPETLEAAHSSRLSVFDPGEATQVTVSDMNLQKISPVRGQGLGPEFPLMSKWFRVTLEFRGLLGARVKQDYDWYTQNQGWRWELHELRANPDPSDIEWTETIRVES